MSEGINVVSTFDGMGCLYIALKELGIKVNKYFAIEIDKHAIKQTKHNFPDIIHLGDIKNVSIKDFQGLPIHLYAGGSPCQGFSFAGKQLNFNDERSALFFEYVRLWQEIKAVNPEVKFLLENVNMKKEYLRVISEYMGVFPVRINSNLVSAQNRDRWYWTNIRTKETGLFSELWTDIPQPEDKGILLKDILQQESEVDDKYYLKSGMLNFLNVRNGANKGKRGLAHITNGSDKSKCLTDQGKMRDSSNTFIKLDRKLEVKQNQNKADCFTAGGNSGGNHSDMDIICVGKNSMGNRFHAADSKHQTLVENGRSNTGTIIQKPHGNNKGGEFKDKSPTVLSNSLEHNNHITDGYRLRRLTPIECSRLQTIPEWYSWAPSSDTQIYKMLGNGWTSKVIEHILSEGIINKVRARK